MSDAPTKRSEERPDAGGMTDTCGAAQALEGVQDELDGLAEGCGRISAALAAARGASAELLGSAERVARDLALSQTRSALVEQFLQQYQLAPGEVAALQARRLQRPAAGPGCTGPCMLYHGSAFVGSSMLGAMQTLPGHTGCTARQCAQSWTVS